MQQIVDKADPDDPFLLHDALDEDGAGTTRVRAHATIRFSIPLPPWISMADDRGATHVTVFRGIPSTRNTPALDRVLLHDGRAATLQEKALGAIHDHYQGTVEPTAAQLDAIAEFERRDAHFFSSSCARAIRRWWTAARATAGNHASRAARAQVPRGRALCASFQGRHLRPVSQRPDAEHGQPGAFGLRRRRPPVGARFFNTGVTLVNQPGNPIRTWVIDDRINPVVTVRSPDVGVILGASPPTPPPSVLPRAFLAGAFKIPTLWGVKDTAPYFHDNGAKTLRDAVAHYQRFFNFTEEQDPVGSRTLGGRIVLTDDDVDDIVAYLKPSEPEQSGQVARRCAPTRPVLQPGTIGAGVRTCP